MNLKKFEEKTKKTLTRVDVRVFLHVALLMESLATELTRIWSGVGMDEQMSAEGAGPLEGFTALFALKDFFRGVDSSVLGQTDLVAEGFVA